MYFMHFYRLCNLAISDDVAVVEFNKKLNNEALMVRFFL